MTLADVASAPALDAGQQSLLRLLHALAERDYAFVTPTPLTHERVNRRPGNERARTLTDALGWSRPFEAGLLPDPLLRLLAEADALDRDGDLLRSRIRVSTLHGSLFIHSAFPTAATDAVFFGPDTYKFCDAIAAGLARHPGAVRRAADICTGAGPGAVTIAKAVPDAEVSMVDINEQALRLAAVNAAAARCGRARPSRSDLLTSLDGAFDLVIAHPPYLVDRDTRAYRHGGGALGADLALAIVDAAVERLAPGGTLMLFTGVAIIDGQDPFRAAAGARLERAGYPWSYREVDPDVFGEELDTPAYATADRIALVVLEAVRPGAGACG